MTANSPNAFVRILSAALLALWGLADLSVLPTGAQGLDDPLSSWEDGAVKTAILDFVAAVTEEGGPDYVPPEQRIATFDDDGTLWVEQPIYAGMVFTADRLRAVVQQKPSLKTDPDVAAVTSNLMALLDLDSPGYTAITDLTDTGVTYTTFRDLVADWISTARHPRFDKLYTDLTYLPMIEVLQYLRAQGFTTFIVSGGNTEFMREWTWPTYGVPPYQVVGSSLGTQYKLIDNRPVLVSTASPSRLNYGPGKPIGIGIHIGQRPIIAFGNSDQDFEMLQYTTVSDGRRLGLIVHHDDAVREYAYDVNSTVGHLDRALNAAPDMGWQVISMHYDWKKIFAWEQ
jgi:hypothetical protein